MRQPYIIAVVGAGGKTTHIHNMAKKYVEQGKKVLVVTTTHMYREPDTVVTDHPEEVFKRLDEGHYCMAGSPADEEKIGRLSEDVWNRVKQEADMILVEADGAKHQLIKYPGEQEPVLPLETDEIHVVMGMAALGQPLSQVCHRVELAESVLGCGGEKPVTLEDIFTLAQEGYEKPLSKAFPKAVIRFVAGKCDTLYQRACGVYFQMKQRNCVLQEEWFFPQPELFLCGAGHVSRKMAELGRFLDFKVTIYDDREEFANQEKFPEGCEVICRDFSELEQCIAQRDGRNMYYAVMTRGHMADRQCVEQILKHSYTYLGMIGSRKKVIQTLNRLEEQGFSREVLNQIHAPIGLDIGSQTPEEIAVSIAAQMIQIKNQSQNSTMTEELSRIQGKGVLCIILSKQGSAPRGTGSMMFVPADSRGHQTLTGSVGGGRVEYETICMAREMCKNLEEETIRVEHYNLSNEESGNLGMICGGCVEMLFLPMPE